MAGIIDFYKYTLSGSTECELNGFESLSQFKEYFEKNLRPFKNEKHLMLHYNVYLFYQRVLEVDPKTLIDELKTGLGWKNDNGFTMEYPNEIKAAMPFYKKLKRPKIKQTLNFTCRHSLEPKRNI